MKKQTSEILLLIFALQSLQSAGPVALAAAPASLEERTAVLKELTQSFSSVCLDASGNILQNVGIIDSSMVDSKGDSNAEPILCEEEAARLGRALRELQEEANAAGPHSEGVNGNCAHCNAPPAEVTPTISIPAQLAGPVSSIGANSCSASPSSPIIEDSSQCFKAAACNAIRGAYAGFIQLGAAIAHAISKESEASLFGECLDSSKTGCFTEFVAGALKDLWSNVTAVWDLAKLAAGGVASVAKSAGRKVMKGWHSLWGVEDKSSEAMLAASQQSPGLIDQFKAHPFEFMKKMSLDLVQMLWSFSKESFGCAKWAGVPHFSKCTESLDSWKCASCDQKINVVCGMAGLAGGEVLVAYLTGGAASVGKAGAKTAIEVTAKVAESLKAVRPIATVVSKIAEVGGAGARMGLAVSEAAVKAAEVLTKSSVASKLMAFSRSGSAAIGRAVDHVAATAPVKVTIKVVNGVTYPIRAYVGLLGKAYSLGVKHMDRALEVAGVGSKVVPKIAKGLAAGKPASEAAQHAEQLEKTQNFHYILGEGEAGAKPAEVLDDVEKSLKAGHVQFKEVESAQGGKAIEIELPRSSCPNGKLTLSLGAAK